MLRAALLSLLLGFAHTANCQAVDILIYPNGGIFTVDDGRPSGPGTVMLTSLQAASGVSLNLQVMPIARAMQVAANRSGTCLVAMPRTAERETQFRWAGPWATGSIAIYGRDSETRRINGPDDLRGSQIAVLRNSDSAAWLKEQGLKGYEVNDLSTGLRMLQAGRVDFWLGNDLPTRFVVKTIGGSAPRVLYSFRRIDLYFACHLATPAAVIDRLNAGTMQLRHNGDLAEFGLR